MKIFKRLHLIFLILFFSSCSTFASFKLKDKHGVKHMIDSVIKDGNTPGLQYIVFNGEKNLVNKSLGYSEITSNNKMDESTKLMAYSMTKTFIAILTLKLHEKGLLNIEDEVIKYLPKMPYGGNLKIKHLINQTSGIPNPIPLRWAHLSHKSKQFNEKEVFWNRVKENSKLDFSPGEKYSYSNLSYAMLGQILEVITEMPLGDLFQEELASPLGIKAKDFGFNYYEDESYAVGYLKRWSFINFLKYFVIDSNMYDEYEDGWLRFNKHYVDYKAMGGLITNARSVGIVLQDLLREDSKLLKPEAKKLLFNISKNNNGEEVEMTLGWHVGEVNGNKFFFKEGGGAGFHCEMRIYPDENIGSVVMTNSTSFDVKVFLNRTDKVWFSNHK